MRKQLAYVLVLGVVAAGLFTLLNSRGTAEAAAVVGPMLAHDVYFALKDNSAEAKKKLVAACKKHLSGHPGEVFFAVGTRAEDLKREVNDTDFDVALHIVFKTREDQDKYQEAERHKLFIKENRDNWKKVRVFDSVVEK